VADTYYPEPTVGALIIDSSGRFLLVRSHKWRNLYVIPGGHIELGETMADALIREVKEETNLDVSDLEFLLFQEFIFDDSFWKQKHFIFFDFACRAVSMDVQLNSESQEYLWIMPEERFELPIDPYTLRTMDAYLKIHSPG